MVVESSKYTQGILAQGDILEKPQRCCVQQSPTSMLGLSPPGQLEMLVSQPEGGYSSQLSPELRSGALGQYLLAPVLNSSFP